jgi:hypothetical protein
MLLETGLTAKLGQEARRSVSQLADQGTVCRQAEAFYQSVLERDGHGF